MNQPAEQNASNNNEEAESKSSSKTTSDVAAPALDKQRDLPAWLWLYVTPLLLIAAIVSWMIDPEIYDMIVRKDDGLDAPAGLAEQMTALVLLPGIGAGILILTKHKMLPQLWLKGWVALFTLALVYFAGEECSWGQHLFHWEAGEFFQKVNDQDETNLHNMSSWLDQKPRMLVELWVLVAGLIVPIVEHFKRKSGKKTLPVGSTAYWFWPTYVCTVGAAITVIIRIPKRIADITDWQWLPHEGTSEIHEFYIALVLTFYLLSIWHRMRWLSQQERNAGSDES